MGPAAEQLRQSYGKSFFVGGELPGYLLSVVEVLTDLGSRPGAGFGPSITREDRGAGGVRREQSMRLQLAPPTQGKSMVLQNLTL